MPGRPHPSVVRVIAPDRDGLSLGSGALVAVSETHGLVVTNWHVVRDAAANPAVVFPDGFRSPATLLSTDRDWDLAALAIWRPPVAPIRLANHTPRPGELLTIAGYGSGRYRAITGRCTQYVSPGPRHPFEMVELSAPARQGDSGGPIFNSRGELAGVLFGSAGGHTTGSYCGRVQRFLATVEGDFQRLHPGSTMIAQGSESSQPAIAQNRPSARVAGIRAINTPPTNQTSQTVGPLTITPQPRLAENRSDFAADQSGSAASWSGDEKPKNVLPVASIPAGFPVEPIVSEPLVVSSNGLPTLPSDPQSAVGETPVPLTWEDIAGSSLGEQIKTVLAAVGLLAIFFHGMRLLTRENEG